MRTDDKYLSLVKTELRNRTVTHVQISLSLLIREESHAVQSDKMMLRDERHRK